MLSIISAAGCGFVATGRFASVAPGAVRSTPVPIMEDSAYDKYMNSRSAGEVEKIDEGYRSVCAMEQNQIACMPLDCHAPALTPACFC